MTDLDSHVLMILVSFAIGALSGWLLRHAGLVKVRHELIEAMIQKQATEQVLEDYRRSHLDEEAQRFRDVQLPEAADKFWT